MCDSWIKSYRSLVDEWRWFRTPLTAHFWEYLRLKAEYKDKADGREIIYRGQLRRTLAEMSEQSGLTIREVRTALSNLESTGEIIKKTTNKYTLITLVNYDEYQDTTTNERQTKDKPKTNLPIKERNKEIKKGKYVDLIAQKTTSEEVREAAMGWVEMRIAKSRPPTENAIHLAFQKLEKISKSKEETIAIFNESTLNGWTGLFPLKE